MKEGKTGGVSSASGWNQPIYEMTATLSTASTPLPSHPLAVHRLLEIYQECLENGDSVKVSLDMHGGVERLPLSLKLPPPCQTPVSQPLTCQRGKPVNERRSRDKRRREAWIERRQIRSLSDPLHHAVVETAATTSLASTGDAVVPHTTATNNCNDWPESPLAAIAIKRHNEPGMPHAMAPPSPTLTSPPAK
jgi:hypothetical protein